MTPLRRSKKAAGTSPCAIGTGGGFHLDHMRPGAGQQVAAERTRPEGGEIDHHEVFGPRARRSVSQPRRHDTRRRPFRRAGRQEARAAWLARAVRPVSGGQCLLDRRPGGGLRPRWRGELEPGGHEIAILFTGQGDRDPAPQHSATSDNFHRSSSHPGATGPSRRHVHPGEPVRSRSENGAADSIESLHESGRWPERLFHRSGECHEATRRPSLSNRVRHHRRVTSRDPGHSQCGRSPR